MAPAKLNVVVAVCSNLGIGIEGRLPWRLKQDMAFFKKVTMDTTKEGKKNMVIMGKNTWMSIPEKFRPLAGRVNVILSRLMKEAPAGALLASSLSQAINIAESDDTIESVFVIGGASVYREVIESDRPCRIYLTRVLKDFECDTFFSEFDTNVFKRIPNPDIVPSDQLEENGVQFSFEVYDKS